MLKDDLLKAISLADEGRWDNAHKTVQDIENEYAYWIHANLHREEGDISNSRYWYSRARRSYTEIEFNLERDEIRREIEEKL
ncbi:MAG: hypothetical protein ACR2NW_10290 [Thermodesulfobacteriota bacterium]